MISNVLNLKQLEALVWVADLGSFRKAAQHLNTTQPNISSRIAALEATLGAPLMQRDAGSVCMTAKGLVVLSSARTVLRETEVLLEVAKRTDLIEDRLRLGVTELVACTWLHDYLRKVKHSYPALAVELTVDLSRHLDKELSSNALDLTIQTSPFEASADGTIELGKFPYVWVTAESCRDESADQLGVKDLIPLNILTHARHTQAFIELTHHAECRSLPKTRFVPSNSLTSCVQMALDGMGVALLPKALVEREIVNGNLNVLNVDWTPTPLRFEARYHTEKVARHVANCAELAAQASQTFRDTHAV